jgi:hypothetical protein
VSDHPSAAAGDRRESTPAELLEGLDGLRGTGPEFDGFLANHGPMAAEALAVLGRPDSIPGWVEQYRRRLDDAPAVRRGIAPDQWREHLGDVDLTGDWHQLIHRESFEMTWQELLARWWARLLPGLAASATHGVIRTGHAVRSLAAATETGRADVDAAVLDATEPGGLLIEELVHGLALWAARYQALPGVPDPHGRLSALAATAALPRLDPAARQTRPGVSGRLAVLDQLDAFPPAVDAWNAPPDPESALDDLIGAAARVVAAREDSPVALCHTVTAPAAVRLALPHLPAELRGPSVAAAWQATAGIVAAFATPRLPAESEATVQHPDEPRPSALGADELADRAVWHGDEHVIKLTEAAVREHARTDDPALLVAAHRFADRVERP